MMRTGRCQMVVGLRSEWKVRKWRQSVSLSLAVKEGRNFR